MFLDKIWSGIEDGSLIMLLRTVLEAVKRSKQTKGKQILEKDLEISMHTFSHTYIYLN